ncbi:MAG: lipid-A-disaccharide synthase N-terminal domain-containing protein [Alphaproteobacteria bacterium]|nr:lipid-A-disaccharide synthase N-terminal domain-containing protein [Alphaproteobacteria bacterium]MDE1986619.1 lipid-A-disaccharide synthase N-terminal domain-containing protein [Alphaproteobacteria bacterium]MDE2164431.1 lipid-A-disaccharide synthase N-terminal domain-containing protein [Alphaproteobacteria bacterium]MDE2264574.1 lipid-A-disaccharide synthase N-terminal domain-containing protein [Alphaproteobacteria bacterium]
MLSWISGDHLWLAFGFGGQALFASRFFIQLFKSEMVGRSVIPVAFWYFSLGGGLITLVYSIHLGQVGLPYVMGQLGGLVVYARNLYLIHREKKVGAPPAAA